MNQIPSSIEKELRNLLPSRFDEDFLNLLTASAEGTMQELSEDLLIFEQKLRQISPAQMNRNFQSSLAHTLGDTPFSLDEKVVLFNKPTAKSQREKKRFVFPRGNLAAVAAVALLGTLGALLMPTNQIGQIITQNSRKLPSILTKSNLYSNFITPTSFSSHLSDTHEEGIVWHGKNQPHRVVRLTYMDEATINKTDGAPVSFKAPRVEYVIVPEKID